MNAPRRIPRWRLSWRRLRRHRWAFFACLLVLAIVSGLVGFYQYHSSRGTSPGVFSLLYLTLQLFTLESGSVEGTVPWTLQLARFLSPLLAVWAALSALAALMGERLRGLRLKRLRGHAVVCGAGRKGLRLVQDFLSHNYQVVVIELDPNNPNLIACRDQGATILTGDAANSLLLRKARVAHADYLAAICADDSVNAEITLRAHREVDGARRDHRSPLHCLVHIADVDLGNSFRTHPIFTDTGDAFQATIFNVYADAARQLLNKQPLDYQTIPAESELTAQLIIIGFGIMGQALAVETARLAHFANGKKTRISVLDLRANERREAFLARYSEFEKACDIDFIQGNIEERESLKTIRDWVYEPRLLTSIAVCLDDEWRCIKTAFRLTELFEDTEIPVSLRLSEGCMLAEIMGRHCGANHQGPTFHAFGRIADVCGLEYILDKNRDALAKAIHQTYCEMQQSVDKKADDPACLSWQELTPAMRDFNRYQADHIAVKLRSIHCKAVAADSVSDPERIIHEFEPDEVELLSRMEHAHYNAKRFIEGWRLGERSHSRRTNPWLIEWAELPEKIREVDRVFVRNIPRYLQGIGLRIVRQ